MNLSIERVVAFLTPAFSAVAAWLTGVIASNFPFLPKIPAGDITALEVTGATVAAAAALKWLHGRSQFVQAAQRAKHELALADKQVAAAVAANPPAEAAVVDLEGLWTAHAADIEASAQAVATKEVQRALSGLSLSFNPAGPPPPEPATQAGTRS